MWTIPTRYIINSYYILGIWKKQILTTLTTFKL